MTARKHAFRSPAVAPQISKIGSRLRITAIIRTNDTPLQTKVESTTNLAVLGWAESGINQVVPVSQTGVPSGFERMTFEVDDAASPARYLRLRFLLNYCMRRQRAALERRDALAAVMKNIIPSVSIGIGRASVMLPIVRDAAGAFTSFGDPGPMQFGESVGRFSGLVPRNKPSVRGAAQAKATLLSLGMNIVNRGFDPTMN